MPALPIDAFRQMVPESWSGRPHSISVEQLYGQLTAHEEGDLSGSSVLGRLLLRDDRIASCVETRVNALLGCKEEICGAEIDDDAEEEKIRDAASAWWPKTVTEATRRALETDAKLYAVAFAETIYARTSKTWTPARFVRWDVGAFRWDDNRDCYLVRTREGGEQEVRHGEGRWVIYEPYGPRGWHNGLIMSLADKWLMRQWTWRDWARFTEKLGQGVFKAVVPVTSKPEDRSKFLAQVGRIGANGAVAVPRGDTDGASFDLELLSTNGTGFQNFETFTAALNVAIAVRCLGQNLTTEAQGGSYAAANVQDRVRGDLLRFDAETESTTLHTGVLVPWTVANYGDADLAPWPHRETEPAEDEKAKAETRKLKIDTLVAASALSPRVDVEHELEELGFDLLDESDVPEAPEPVPPVAAPPLPEGDAPAETPEEALSRGRGPLIKLAGDNPARFLHAGQTWVNGLVDAATELSAPEVSKVILSIKRAAKEASGYEDFRLRLIDMASEAPTAASVDMFERAILLAVGQGTYSASLEIDAGP